MPPPIVCYICGRNYSTASLKIHIPNCIKKWESDQKKLPKAQRRPLPAEPSSFDRVLKGEVGAKDMEKYSQEAFENYNNVALEPCANCGRTFNHSALEIHQRSCKVKLSPGSKRRPSRASPTPQPQPSPERGPTRKQLIRFIEREEVFTNPDTRRELMDFMQDLRLKT